MILPCHNSYQLTSGLLKVLKLEHERLLDGNGALRELKDGDSEKASPLEGRSVAGYL